MQANGAEMLRLACCLGIERGIKICAPVHDAVLIESPLDRLKDDVAIMRECMEKASRVVLGGFALRTEFKTVRYPYHYQDPRGERCGRSLLVMSDLNPDPFLDSIRITAELTQNFPGKQDGSKPSEKRPEVRDSTSTNSRWRWQKTL